MSLDSEPIETHPDFKTFAGEWDDKSTWKSGIVGFDAEGKFLGFKGTLPGGASNLKGGVRNFLVPGVVYGRVRVVPSIIASAVGVSAAAAGKIQAPPSSRILPAVASGKNWLALGRGNGRGWNAHHRTLATLRP